MKKNFIIFLIILIAFVLRFFGLGDNPASLDWDEASLGYNAYSILKTGRDEYGTFLPISIRSFGDYKPAMYTYLTVSAVSVFGLTEYAVRLPSAVFGTFSVFVCYLLVRKLFPDRSLKLPFLATFLLAVSPWHIQFSRIAFEANVGVFFFISGVYLFLKSTEKNWVIFPSLLSFAASMYSYHSPRLVVPLLLIGALVLFKKQLWQKKGIFVLACIMLFIIVLPIVRQMTSTAARFGSVSVLNPAEKLGDSIEAIEYDQLRDDYPGKLTHNRRIVFAREILGGYLDHFNFDFLFLNGDPPGRHHAAGMGMLYILELPFLLIGILYLISVFFKDAYDRRKIGLLFWWFLIAPAASSLTSGTPHAVRALLYLPTYQIFTAYGIYRFIQNGYMVKWLYGFSSTIKPFNHITIANIFRSLVLCLLFTVNFHYYLTMYYIHTPVEYASEWQYGYKEAVSAVRQIEDRFDRVIVTYRYDQPYVYFLFHNMIDPAWYQQTWGGGEIQRFNRDFGKYEFRNIDWERDSRLANVLLVGTPAEIPDDAAGKISDIFFPDGTVAFRIIGR